MDKIVSAKTKVNKSGKNTDGKMRLMMWIPRKIIKELNLSPGSHIGFNMWNHITEKTTTTATPVESKPTQFTPIETNEVLSEQELEFIRIYNQMQQIRTIRAAEVKKRAIIQFGEERVIGLMAWQEKKKKDVKIYKSTSEHTS